MTIVSSRLILSFDDINISSGVQVSWSSNRVTVTEGDNVSISLLLDREPGVDLMITISSMDLNTTGCYLFICT